MASNARGNLSQPTAPATPSLDDWLASKRRFVLAAIIALSFAVRAIYYVEVVHGPLSVQHHWDQSDMHYFDIWARAIAAGDWLSRDVAPPMHAWHFQVAADHFRRHPAELARLRPTAAAVEQFFARYPDANLLVNRVCEGPDKPYFVQHPEALQPLREQIVATSNLWQEWGGLRRFHQEPLYPYLVALTYKIAGPDARYVFLWQLLLGVLSNVLVYLIALRYFGDTAAALAGLMATLCAPLLYFEMVLLRETLIVFTGLLLVWLAGTALQRGTVRRWLTTGAVIGLSLTLKSHFVLFLLGVLGILAWQHRKNLRQLWRFETATILGVLLALAPQAARSLAVGISPFAAPGNGSITFVHGNANEPDAAPLDMRFRHAAEIMGHSGGRLLPTIAATLQRYDNPRAYFFLLWEKAKATWHWVEPPDNTNFYFYRLHAPILRLLPVTFFLVAPLSLVGLLLGIAPIRRWTTGACTSDRLPPSHLYLLVLTNMVVLLAFLVRDRYRAPLTAAVIPFAALTLSVMLLQLRNHRPRKAAVVAAAVVLFALWTSSPLRLPSPLIRPADYEAAYQVYYDPLEHQALKAGDHPKAAAILDESLGFEPQCVKLLDAAHRPSQPAIAALGSLFAAVHSRCAEDYRLAGQHDKAALQRARADELSASCVSR
ncbi:MAG: glycosyltransferase family 39 protein [Planctomycetaceae bacterium]|nr:glycosyltransferase family 39 protein [Planctomycetaceae bacterium]